MDLVTRGLEFVFVYSDDILVAFRNEHEHVDHLRRLFSRLKEHGQVINTKKCNFAVSELKFPGHHVAAYGISPLQERFEAVCNSPRPMTVKQLQRYLGMLNFYRRFLKNVAHSDTYTAICPHQLEKTGMERRCSSRFRRIEDSLGGSHLAVLSGKHFEDLDDSRRVRNSCWCGFAALGPRP